MELELLKQRIDSAFIPKVAKWAWAMIIVSHQTINEEKLNEYIYAWKTLLPRQINGDKEAGKQFEEIIKPYLTELTRVINSNTFQKYAFSKQTEDNPFIGKSVIQYGHNKQTVYPLDLEGFFKFITLLGKNPLFEDRQSFMTLYNEFRIEAEQCFGLIQIETTTDNYFKTKLKYDQLKTLFKRLTEKDGLIDPNTHEYNFLYVFGHPLPKGKVFESIIWLKSKTALRELLTFISGYQINDTLYLPNEVVNKIIPRLFKNEKGEGITINKKKNNEYSLDYTKLETILKNL